MPQSPVQRVSNTFNKGLLTEFSELNFPENASVDELNCDLLKAGNRTRRLGIQYEVDHALSGTAYNVESHNEVVGKWQRVGNDPEVEYIVVKAENYLIFYESNKDGSLSSNTVKESFTSSTVLRIDLNDHIVASSGISLAIAPVEITSLNGVLIVVGKGLNAFYIERDKGDGSFSTTQINFKIRDFEWQVDNIEDLYTSTATLTAAREYDTVNAGWDNDNTGTQYYVSYHTSEGVYPPLVLPWYAGKDSTGNFDVAEWKKIGAGTTLQANGHYILDLFNKDRATASNVLGMVTESTTDRFSTVATFAGRVFYGGYGSRIYFSKIIEDRNEFGILHQVNDPTSEEFSDLLDTDGGWVDIKEAVNVSRLHVFGSSLLVFAENGVWRVTGVDGVFRATEYSVYRVSDIGIAQPRSLVAGENATPYWWSFAGIMTVQVTEEGGMVEVNLSRPTIQTFWRSIADTAKNTVRGAYDGFNGRVVWLYADNNATNARKVNNFLFLDTELGAFFPWKVSDKATNTPTILDATYIEGFILATDTFNVLDSSGNQVIDSSTNTVVAELEVATKASSNLKFLTVDADGYLTFSEFSSTSFYDWGDANYSSYAENGYDFMGDIGRRKNAPYLTVACRTSETAFEADGGTYVFTRPSSILVSCYWDFRNIASVNQQQGYRILRPVVVDETDLTYTPERTVNVNRLKLRGRGRIMRLRFESEEGKDFNLLGWEVLGATNPGY